MSVNMHGVKIMTASEMLEERRALLKRLEAGPAYPGLERFIRAVQGDIRILEARAGKEDTE